MRHNHLVLMAIAFVLSLAFAGCKKDTPETVTPKITNDKVEATITSATFTWKVEWLGNRISVVELSERMDMSDSHFFGSEEELNKETFIVLVEDLEPGTKYYYRYWVWNQNYVSNKFVMETKSFSTKTDLATVKTMEVTDITRTSAMGQGEILSDGGLEVTERGMCWSKNHNPTISGSHAASSQNTTTFSVLMTDLTPEETYYVRAYAKNANGTAYSENEMWFVTGDAVPPTVTTAQVTDISWRTAIGGGEVTDDGDAMVIERGLCWSTNENPTIEDSHIGSGSGTGSFTADIAGLTAGTTYHVRAYAMNTMGYGYGDDVTFKTADAVAPTVTTVNPTDITRTAAVCGGNVTSDGGSDITERGLCWGTDSNLSISGNHLAATENGMGSFTVRITGLAPNTLYYVCSYAKNNADICYGAPKSFETLSIGKPTVITTQVSNITQTTATSGGNVTDDGGAEVTERGICWSTEHNPSISNNLGCVHIGEGTEAFILNMTGLTYATKYYVRAYAKNSVDTGYGEEVEFTTLAEKPTVTTLPVTNITRITATGNGRVDSDGGAPVTERGVCWGVFHNPDITGGHATNGAGEGSYSALINGLNPNTKYYVRAYAKNEIGTQYGRELEFTTDDIGLPAVTTSSVTGIAQTAATGGGIVTDDGGGTILERGVCWGTSINPDIDGTHLSASGSGLGSFSVSMTNLTPSTDYYVRAYARNNVGIAYGDDVTFRTLSEPSAPILETLEVTDITTSSALGGGNITDNGGFTIAERGICWAKVHNPNTSHNYLSCGSGDIGVFSGTMTALEPGTTYYVRAYARNSFGERYGNEVSFTTAMPQPPTGAICGLFTVGANYYSGPKQVWFAQGNLQYQASSNLWRFAENQWDFIGEANSNISQTYSGWIDLFGWGTSGYNHGATCWQPWSTNTDGNGNRYYAYGQARKSLNDETGQADWGYNEIFNGGNQTNNWRTLTDEEWSYVFNTRDTPSTIRYAMAVVNGVNGVILLPDNWNMSYNLNNFNDEDAAFSSNVISGSEWITSFQANGAVFLPAAGTRSGTTIDKAGTAGYYWSTKYKVSSSSGTTYYSAYELGFGHMYGGESNNLIPGTHYARRYYGNSVRLVRDAQ